MAVVSTGLNTLNGLHKCKYHTAFPIAFSILKLSAVPQICNINHKRFKSNTGRNQIGHDAFLVELCCLYPKLDRMRGPSHHAVGALNRHPVIVRSGCLGFMYVMVEYSPND